MIKELEIVKGGVAAKDLVPILTHLKIKNNWVTSTNGRMTITTPITGTAGLDIIVPAAKFIRAMKGKDRKLKITPGGKLSISGGGFRALLPLMILKQIICSVLSNE